MNCIAKTVCCNVCNMPKKSERLLLLKGMDYVLRTKAIDGKEESPDFEKIFELKMDQRLPGSSVERNAMLWLYPNKTFTWMKPASS